MYGNKKQERKSMCRLYKYLTNQVILIHCCFDVVYYNLHDSNLIGIIYYDTSYLVGSCTQGILKITIHLSRNGKLLFLFPYFLHHTSIPTYVATYILLNIKFLLKDIRM